MLRGDPASAASRGLRGLTQDEQGGDPSQTKPIGQHSSEMRWWRLKHEMENPLNACSQAVKTYCKDCRYCES